MKLSVYLAGASRELPRVKRYVKVLEEERKASAAEFKERKEEIDGTIVRLTNVVNSGIEPRQIECEERPNYHDRTVEIWRLDLEEQAGSRPMEPHELQAELKLLKGEGEEKSSRRRH
jgi:hypothetical protein